MILAAVDIGSNACRMLINNVHRYNDGTIDYTKLNLLRIPLRLGFDVFQQGYISQDKITMIEDAMRTYQLLAKIYKVEMMRVCATSAMRDARNGMEIIQSVLEKTGLQIEIISGAEEATILYQTHIAKKNIVDEITIYVDVGGGSTEITAFYKDKLLDKQSFNIGTIRVLQNLTTVKDWNDILLFLKQIPLKSKKIKLIGSGGNINKLFTLSKNKEGKPLTLHMIKSYYKSMKQMSIEDRMHIYNIREDRADVIVPAMEIYQYVMKQLNINEIYVPKIGLADGLIKLMYQECNKKFRDT